jgi:hypothetical protein
MTPEEIRLRRLYNQHVLAPSLNDPTQVVAHLAAMQAQEYAHAKWAIALRMKEPVTDDAIEILFTEGKILRTHMLRPTWHFVAPQDIRWMLELTAPRVNAVNAFTYRRYGLDDKVFSKSNTLIEKLLRDNNYLTRDAIKDELKKTGITGDGIMLSAIMMKAELDGLICSGPRIGNQFSYALLEERVPPAKKLTKQEALKELTLRYFTSRGPATIKDYTTWSGLTVKEAKEGLSLNPDLDKVTIEGAEYYFTGDVPKVKGGKVTFLMPDYDEYGMGYKDRSVLKIPASPEKPKFDRMLIVDGVIAGSWRRTLQKDTVLLDIQLFKGYSASDKAIEEAITKYENFLSKKIILHNGDHL